MSQKKQMKKLAQDTAIYGVSSILGKFLNWLLVPLYTFFLESSAEYGQITNLYSWTALLLVILTYGMETGFFRFGGDVKPEQNNFCGLGTTGGGVKGAHFKTPEIGVRAHIQHLLAYTTQKHPSTKIVDPRYDLAHAIRLERGLCDTWYKLNGTWAMSPNYSEKIMGVWQRMLGIEAVETKSEKYKNEHDKKDNKVKEEVNTTEDQHKMRELVDELLKKNK